MINKENAILFIFIFILFIIPVIGAGCEEEEVEIPTTAPPSRMGLSSTLVPDTDFDVYVYVKQDNPTPILKDILGTPFDVSVDSLALWGVTTEDSYAFAGGLAFTSPNNAADVHEQVPVHGNIWTSLSNHMIYFVHGSGTTEDALKSTISNGNFKNYDNELVLSELLVLPEGEETKLIAVAAAVPHQALANLLAKYTVPEASSLLNILMTTANVEVITAGFYSQRQINVAEIAKDIKLSNILASEMGILVSVKSAWPEIIVSSIVSAALESAGYEKTYLGDLEIYRGNLTLDNADALPLLFRIVDNRLFVAVSIRESYAQKLISSPDT